MADGEGSLSPYSQAARRAHHADANFVKQSVLARPMGPTGLNYILNSRQLGLPVTDGTALSIS